MSAARITGRARRLGDHINTDYIIASTRKRDTLDTTVLKRYLLETVDPAFAASVQPGDVIVAGRNFGCGSAMEIAATVILAAGIQVVLAQSFARTFYRNAFNNGLLPIECETAAILEGHPLVIECEEGRTAVTDEATGGRVHGAAIPDLMLAVFDAGGLVGYLRRHGRLTARTL